MKAYHHYRPASLILKIYILFTLVTASACAGVDRSNVIAFDFKSSDTNVCQGFVARPSFPYDMGFVVCKTEKKIIEVTCKVDQTKDPPDRQKANNSIEKITNIKTTAVTVNKKVTEKDDLTGEVNCKSALPNTLTVRTTTETDYSFPTVSVSGGWGSITNLGVATVGGAAIVGAARVK